MRWHHFGLAGGSYFRTAAVLDSFAPERVVNIDFLGFKQEMGNNAFTSDLIMHVALTMRGWTVYPWKECAQNMTKGAPLDEDRDATELGRPRAIAGGQRKPEERAPEGVEKRGKQLVLGVGRPSGVGAFHGG